MVAVFYDKKNDKMVRYEGVEVLGITRPITSGRTQTVYQLKLYDDESGEYVVSLPVKDYELYRVKEA